VHVIAVTGVTAALAILAVAAVIRGRGAAKHVFRSGISLLLLVLALVALDKAPILVQIGVGVVGLAFIVGDGFFTHKTEATAEMTQRDVQKRLDVLDEISINRKVDLMGRARKVIFAISEALKSRQTAKLFADPKIKEEQPEMAAFHERTDDFSVCYEFHQHHSAEVEGILGASALYVNMNAEAVTNACRCPKDLEELGIL
jgi:hypothetical protein